MKVPSSVCKHSNNSTVAVQNSKKWEMVAIRLTPARMDHLGKKICCFFFKHCSLTILANMWNECSNNSYQFNSKYTPISRDGKKKLCLNTKESELWFNFYFCYGSLAHSGHLKICSIQCTTVNVQVSNLPEKVVWNHKTQILRISYRSNTKHTWTTSSRKKNRYCFGAFKICDS